MVYYNDNDRFCCDWLRNLIAVGLIPDGFVDERSIADVQPKDVEGFKQAHFFAGIGGWPLALQLAGWPATSPVWTGSCPCQPLSCAGKRKGHEDERHLWPVFYRLIRECRPRVVLGEQVGSKDGLEWLAGVFADLEDAGYACGAADLCAASVGAPHIRQRLYWVAKSSSGELQPRAKGCRVSSMGDEEQRQEGRSADHVDGSSIAGRVADAASDRATRYTGEEKETRVACGVESACGGIIGRLADAERDGGRIDEPQRREERRVADRRIGTGIGELADADSGRHDAGERQPLAVEASTAGHWSNFVIAQCRDGKARRISSQCGDEPLAYGIPAKLGPELAGIRGLAKSARRNRVGRLKGYGNAIVPQVAAEFVRAFMEASNG